MLCNHNMLKTFDKMNEWRHILRNVLKRTQSKGKNGRANMFGSDCNSFFIGCGHKNVECVAKRKDSVMHTAWFSFWCSAAFLLISNENHKIVVFYVSRTHVHVCCSTKAYPLQFLCFPTFAFDPIHLAIHSFVCQWCVYYFHWNIVPFRSFHSSSLFSLLLLIDKRRCMRTIMYHP